MSNFKKLAKARKSAGASIRNCHVTTDTVCPVKRTVSKGERVTSTPSMQWVDKRPSGSSMMQYDYT